MTCLRIPVADLHQPQSSLAASSHRGFEGSGGLRACVSDFVGWQQARSRSVGIGLCSVPSGHDNIGLFAGDLRATRKSNHPCEIMRSC